MADNGLAGATNQQQNTDLGRSLPPSSNPTPYGTADSSPESWLSKHAPGLLVLFLVLSNVAAIFKFLQDSTEIIAFVSKVIPDYVSFWLLATIVAAVVLIGNALLAWYLYRRFASGQITRHKLIVLAVIALTITSILTLNLYSLSALRPDIRRVQLQLEGELLSAQAAGDNSGFRTTLDDPKTREDAWTTAQAVEALLLADKDQHRQEIRSALNFLKSNRGPNGWYADPSFSPTPFVRTEISSWVIIAYLRSLRSTDVWNSNEEPQIVNLVSSYIEELIFWQDTSTGAWASLPDHREEYDRTYPTTMAVWALTEAYSTPQLNKELKAKAAAALKPGFIWLIRRYKLGHGWDVNPQQPVSDRFDGLNFQTFFVLEKAAALPNINSLKELPNYEELKKDFLGQLRTVPITEYTQVSSNDLLVAGKPCWATFLSYPWSLALMSELADEHDLTSADRRKVATIARSEAQRMSDLPKDLEHKDTWKVAEMLIGVSHIKYH